MYKFQKKLQLRKSTYAALPAVFYAVLTLPLAGNAQAGCSRADVDHYLEKGFTHAQVTTLCADTTSAQADVSIAKVPAQLTPQSQDAAASQPGPPESGTKQELSPAQESGSFFASAIEGYDVVLASDTLSYTRRKCYDFGEEDLFGFAPEVCPEVRYQINLNGLEVLQTGKRYFLFGAPQITVKGKISREVLSGLQDLKGKEKETIKTLIGTGTEELLPIRQGTPGDLVEAELKKLIR